MTTIDSSNEIKKNDIEASEHHEDFRMFGLITFLIADGMTFAHNSAENQRPRVIRQCSRAEFCLLPALKEQKTLLHGPQRDQRSCVK